MKIKFDSLADYIKQIRKDIGLNQTDFGLAVWPNDKPALCQGRIAKYETSKAIPPGNVVLKIQDLHSIWKLGQKKQ